MKILNKLSFHKKIFLACLLTALVPLLCSSVVMIRLFTAALDRQNLDEGRTQITKAEARLEAVFLSVQNIHTLNERRNGRYR